MFGGLPALFLCGAQAARVCKVKKNVMKWSLGFFRAQSREKKNKPCQPRLLRGRVKVEGP